MKDYSLDPQSKKNFIVDVFVVNDQTLTVVFADGTSFEGIAYTQESVDKICDILEHQAHNAVANMKVFKMKEAFATGAVVASIGATYGLSYLSSVHQWTTDPVAATVLGIGSACAFVGPAVVSLFKNIERMRELKKIKYRDDHRDTLEEFVKHPNSLAGVQNKKHFSSCRSHREDPFSMMSINRFTQVDLETIVSNVERENSFAFTYQKKLPR